MKTILYVGVFAYLLAGQTAMAQITSEQITGTWGLVGFDFKAQNKSGELTVAEKETFSMMQKALKQQPKFMKLTFNADGTFKSEPDAYKSYMEMPTWELKDKVVIIKINKKVVERYNARIASNGWLELKAVKSKIAIPIMSLEKD